MTLIEVLAGLALLGTLLAVIVFAKAQLAEDWAQGRKRIAAVKAADFLLTTWWDHDLQKLPRHGSGSIPGHAEWMWQTRVRTSDLLDGLEGQVIRLEIVERGAVRAEAFSAVEFVAPLPQELEDENAGAGL